MIENRLSVQKLAFLAIFTKPNFPDYAFISIVIILQTVKSVQNKSSSDLKIQNNILSVCLCFATARVQFILSGLPIAVKMDARKIVSAKVQLKYAFCHIHSSL